MPSSEKPVIEWTKDSTTLTLTLTEEIDYEHIIKKKINVEYKIKQTEFEPATTINHQVEHHHFKTWEPKESDFVNNTDQLTQLLLLANECADDLMSSFVNLCDGDSNPQKLAITCKSGVGRTGTLMGLINCLICLKEQEHSKSKTLSIFSIVRRLREQRYELCKTRD